MLPNKCSRSLEEKSMRRFEQPGLGTGLPGLPSTARVGTLQREADCLRAKVSPQQEAGLTKGQDGGSDVQKQGWSQGCSR